MNTVILRNAKFVETTFSDGSKQLVGTVRGDSFVGTNIPTEPNPRQFVGEANQNYKEMVKTLRSEPEMFARKNSAGITMFASSIDNNGDGSYTVKFGNKDGIANGGHTYHALKAAGRVDSQVKVTIEIGLDLNKSVEIATALNLNKRLQAYSLHNKEGAFDWHKKAIGNGAKDVIYHEGGTGSLEVKEDIAYLNLFKYDLEDGVLNIRENIKQSDHGGATLNVFVQDDDKANTVKSSLTWVAKDVHELAMYVTFDETMVTMLAPFKKSLGQNWLKVRSGKKGIIKGLGLMLVAGLAEVGTDINRNGIVTWTEKYKSAEVRKAFIKALFDKITVIMPLYEGNVSTIVREGAFKENVLKFANTIDKELVVK